MAANTQIYWAKIRTNTSHSHHYPPARDGGAAIVSKNATNDAKGVQDLDGAEVSQGVAKVNPSLQVHIWWLLQ